MQDWITALIVPLAEMNPVKYVLDSTYRASANLRLGGRAKRILIYQVLVVAAALVVVVLVLNTWQQVQ